MDEPWFLRLLQENIITRAIPFLHLKSIRTMGHQGMILISTRQCTALLGDTAPVPDPFLWTLDFRLWTWILDVGLGLGLYNIYNLSLKDLKRKFFIKIKHKSNKVILPIPRILVRCSTILFVEGGGINETLVFLSQNKNKNK